MLSVLTWGMSQPSLPSRSSRSWASTLLRTLAAAALNAQTVGSAVPLNSGKRLLGSRFVLLSTV